MSQERLTELTKSYIDGLNAGIITELSTGKYMETILISDMIILSDFQSSKDKDLEGYELIKEDFISRLNEYPDKNPCVQYMELSETESGQYWIVDGANRIQILISLGFKRLPMFWFRIRKRTAEELSKDLISFNTRASNLTDWGRIKLLQALEKNGKAKEDIIKDMNISSRKYYELKRIVPHGEQDPELRKNITVKNLDEGLSGLDDDQVKKFKQTVSAIVKKREGSIGRKEVLKIKNEIVNEEIGKEFEEERPVTTSSYLRNKIKKLIEENNGVAMGWRYNIVIPDTREIMPVDRNGNPMTREEMNKLVEKGKVLKNAKE